MSILTGGLCQPRSREPRITTRRPAVSRRRHVHRDYNRRAVRPPTAGVRPASFMIIALTVLAVVAALATGFVWGRRTGASTAAGASVTKHAVEREPSDAIDPTIAERARLLRSFEAECAALRRVAASDGAALHHATTLADERRQLFEQIAERKAETARYRQLVIDIENDAPPPLLGGRGTPDDLKLIVGIGPVLERMLRELGITTYRQIARWTERDIERIEARLGGFPGRIRRDGWVAQARALHQSLHGDML